MKWLVALAILGTQTGISLTSKVECKLGSAEVVAVCAIEGDEVSCWRPDGSDDPKVAAQFVDHWQSQEMGLPTRLDATNRYALLRLSYVKGYKLSDGQMVLGGLLQGRPDRYATWQQSDMKTDAGAVKVLHVAAPKDGNLTTIQMTATTYGSPVLTELSNGNSVRVEGKVVRIGSVQVLPASQMRSGPIETGPQWSIQMDVEDDPGMINKYRFRALGVDRKPILGVDDLGGAVSSEIVLPFTADTPTYFRSTAYAVPPQRARVSLSVLASGEPSIQLVTNVDPRFFKILEITPTRTETFKLAVSLRGSK